jgi:hypothetical protein
MMSDQKVQDPCFLAGRLERFKARYSRPFRQGRTSPETADRQ